MAVSIHQPSCPIWQALGDPLNRWDLLCLHGAVGCWCTCQETLVQSRVPWAIRGWTMKNEDRRNKELRITWRLHWETCFWTWFLGIWKTTFPKQWLISGLSHLLVMVNFGPWNTLCNLLHSYWKWPIYSGFTHWKWWFSIVMLVY